MAKMTTRGLELYLSKSATTYATDTLTGVTKASPAVVTPTTIGSFADGDIVLIEGTGMESLDGKYFVISGKDVDSFELDCSDSSGEDAAATTGTATIYSLDDMAPWCLTTYSYEKPQAEVVDVTTFCDDETVTLAGRAQTATYSVAGFVDGCEEGHAEMMLALEDQNPRVLVIKKPGTPASYIIQTIDITQYSENYELGNAVAFTAGGTVKTGPFRSNCKACA